MKRKHKKAQEALAVLGLNKYATKEDIIKKTDDMTKTSLSSEDLINMIQEKIKITNIEKVKNDIRPFIKDEKILDKWDESYFIKMAESIKAE